MLLITLLIIVSPLILWLAYWYLKVKNYERYLKNIPGPRGLPFLGNALELSSSTGILPNLMKYYDKYKTNFKLYVGAQPYLFIVEHKDLEFILNSTTILKKSEIYDYIKNWLGLGLLTSTGNRWRKHRKILTPAFHFQILEDFIDVFNSQSEILVSKLKCEVNKGSVDVYPLVARCTLDIICETAMGTSVNAQDDLDSEYVKSVNCLLKVITDRTFNPMLGNDAIYMFTETYRQEKHALKILHNYTASVVTRRKAEFFGDSKNYEESVDSLGRKKRRAFLDLLLDYSTKDSSFTEEDIRQEVDTFMFEGHDTTATSISFALYAIATHPDIQNCCCTPVTIITSFVYCSWVNRIHSITIRELKGMREKNYRGATTIVNTLKKKVYAEIQNIFSDDPKRSTTYKDLQEMKYLEMVIKESLRLFVTVPQIGRVLEKDVDWNGVLLPKGLMITIFLHGVLHSPNFFENPEKFDPERHNAENSKSRNPYSFIPFSAGPRNCIGQKFAILEMKSAISHILRTFELLPTVPKHNILIQSEGVLKSANGVYIRLKNRE